MTNNGENLKFFKKSGLCVTLAAILTLASFSVGCSKTKSEKKAESLANTNSTYEDKKSTTEAAPTTTEQNNNTNPSTNSSEATVNTSMSNAESNTNLNKTTSSNSNSKNTSCISKTNGNSSATSSSGTISTPASNSSSGATSTPASNPSSATQPTPINYTYGNTTGNLTNNGISVFDGQYIYFKGSANGTGTYKINPNDTTSTKVSSTSGYSYNVSGDWIFYCNNYPDDSKGIFKIKKDGTGYTKLSTDVPTYISVVNDWIYYVAVDSTKDTPRLCKIKTDGTNRSYIDVSSNNTLVFTDYFKVIPYNGWLFINLFNTTDHKTSFYKIRPDGSNITKVIDGAKEHFSIEGNNIYYLSSNYREIWRCDLDGTAKTMIYSTPSSDFCIYSLNVSGSYIYFSSDNQSASVSNQGIYKIKTDGSGFTKLTNICTKFITIVSDWIFFDGSTDNTRGIMTIKTDGSKVSISN